MEDVMLRKARIDDFNYFYEIKSEDDNLFWCGYAKKPIVDNLWLFWNKYIQDNSERTIFMIIIENKPCGYVYVDYKNMNNVELSIGVSSKCSGKGIATCAIQEIVLKLRKYNVPEIFAYIREDNSRSERVFTKSGFIKTNLYRKLKLENSIDEITLFKWTYEDSCKL